ncbi:hypothetical protein [Mucisphaera sp.]|uniref:hypothetical protein n=1 Tax=Mucisphaera sp. TaxID=2913024 RepID=UPI003D0A479F
MKTPIYAAKQEKVSTDPDGYDWEQFKPLHRSYLSLQHGRALRRVNLTALATDRYHLDHNTFPTTLDQLVPDYLPAIPEDPFNPGQPLKLTPSPFGVIIYSLGDDLTDNNGRRYAEDGRDRQPGTDITAYAFTTPGIPQPLPDPAKDLN